MSSFKLYLIIALIYLSISLVIFWPVTANITNTIVGGVPSSIFPGSGDVYQNLWTLWWVNYAIFALHTSPYLTNLLYAPVGASLVTETLSPLAALFSLPFQAISLGFSYNVIFFLDFALCGLFMFFLADHIVKNKYAAFVAGIVFAFSPFHLMHAGVGHLNWDSIEFLPLFVLFLLKMIESSKWKYAVFAGISFVFLMFFGDPEQGLITIIFVAFFLLLYIARNSKACSQICNRAFLKNIGLAAIVTLLLGAPFLIPISIGISHGAIAAANLDNSLKSYMISSDPLLSFFLPSPYNNFFTSLSSSYYSIYIDNPTERVAYIGYVALILAALGIWKDKKNRFANIFPWIVITVLFAYFALGPYVQFGNYFTPGQYSVPGIYAAISQIPILNLVREPARFDMIVTLSLAILVAYGFKAFSSTYAKSAKIRNFELYAALAITLLMLIEYNGIPVSHSFINSYFFSLSISHGYSVLGQMTSNFTVMILPTIQNIGENPTVFHPQLYTGISMYYQTVFKKPIIGGYTSRVNYTQQLQALEIPFSVYGSFLQRGLNFVYTSPVTENYSNVTLYWLTKYNVQYVTVIKSAYSVQNLTVLLGKLQTLFGKPYYNDNSTVIFSTNAAIARSFNKSIIAYPSLGVWFNGCNTDAFCDQNSNTYWWGTNVRGVSVFAPKNMTRASMSFYGISYYYNQQIPLSVTVESGATHTYVLNMTLSSKYFTIPLNLSPGTANIIFHSAPGFGDGPAINYSFGIRNITFSTR
ncbi:MAG: hypothetical protein ACREBF_03050 [Candidatus Micrarchaeales archaeon]